MADTATPSRGRRRRSGGPERPPARTRDYRVIRNTLPRATLFSEDEIEAIHDASLRVLEELGIRVLLPEGREILRRAGATVDDDTAFVKIDRGIIEDAVAKAPASFTLRPRGERRVLPIGGDHVYFGAGAGCPNITDLDRGRRPGKFTDFIETTKLHQSFDIIPGLSPSIEPQDLPITTRHLDVMRTQLVLSDKTPWIFARGTGQTLDSFEMIRIAQGLSEDAFRARPCSYTVINTNSPRQLDRPMTQGIIDFARWGQPSIITPFCLIGAMAPITIAGALTLSHAEAMAGVAIAQLVNPGAPVVYGAFSSNVDMKSGAPAFGTPEHIKANFAAGQLARRVNLPWRTAAGSASNAADAQGANENQAALWGALLAGGNIIFHAAGWLEGGLVFSMEKFITDIEVLQTIAEAMGPEAAGPAEIGFDAIAEVPPGGHFFSAAQTMERYRDAFYEPIVSDWSNFGQWTEAGSRDATTRARDIWRATLDAFEAPPTDPGTLEALDAFIARRRAEGGSHPME